MATRQARISISADIGTLKERVDQAKRLLSTISQVKVDPNFSRQFEKALGDSLQKNAERVKNQIDMVNKRLEQMGKASEEVFDSRKAERLTLALGRLKGQLQDIERTQKSIGVPGAAAPGAGGAGVGAGGGLAGGLTRFGGGAMRLAGLIGVGLGVGSLYSRRLQISQESMAIRQLSGGATVGRESELGFTPQERRARALELVRGAGRGMNETEITRMTNLSERLERAYGITGEEAASAIGAARRGGVQDQEQFLTNAVSAAVMAGMDGSRIGEFLQSITGYMEQLSQGISVDNKSLIGLAGALSEVPFFRDNAQRTIQTLEMVSDAFRSRDRFQQALSSRAIQGAAGRPLGPFGVEIRRQLGLFGGLRPDRPEDARLLQLFRSQSGGADFAAALQTGGTDLFRSRARQAMEATEGMDVGARALQFIERMGLGQSPQGIESGLRMFGEMLQGGGRISEDTIKKAQEAMVDPTERLNRNMQTLDGRMLDLNSNVQVLNDILADRVTIASLAVYDQLKQLVSELKQKGLMSGSGTELAANVATGAVIVGGAAALGGGLLKRGAGALGRGVSALGRGAASFGRGALSAGRAVLPFGKAAGAVGLAGAGGYLLGTGIKSGAEYLTGDERLFERPFGMLPEWAGGLSEEQYRDVYGNRSMSNDSIPTEIRQKEIDQEAEYFNSLKELRDALLPIRDMNNKTNLDQNTDAIKNLTDALKNIRSEGGAGGLRIPSGAQTIPGRVGSGPIR